MQKGNSIVFFFLRSRVQVLFVCVNNAQTVPTCISVLRVLRGTHSVCPHLSCAPPPYKHTQTCTHIRCTPVCLIHNSLSKVGRDVPVLDTNKVNLAYPQFSLEIRRITFTSGLGHYSVPSLPTGRRSREWASVGRGTYECTFLSNYTYIQHTLLMS